MLIFPENVNPADLNGVNKTKHAQLQGAGTGVLPLSQLLVKTVEKS